MEIESEGEEDFVKGGLGDLVEAAVKLRETAQSGLRARPNGAEHNNSSQRHQSGNSLKLTTSTIAAQLGVNSGHDLLVAAAAQLTFVQDKQSFTRKELLAEARSASAYYKENMRKNLSNYLNSLVKASTLNEVSAGVFALHANTRAELESKIVSR